MSSIWIILAALLFLILTYQRAHLSVFTLSYGVYLFILSVFALLSKPLLVIFWTLYIIIALVLNIRPLRRKLITQPIFNLYCKILPKLSVTEKEALTAGTVGWDGELFSGMPDWDKMRKYAKAVLSDEEREFIQGPVHELCSMLDNWDITHNRFNLPEPVWEFLKKEGFFGLIIPKKYGGKAFSAFAHSSILTMIAGKSSSVASVVAVPNSLGPAELLMHYGTQEQQDHYLPRLAAGIELPCFALTGPEAGSDASAMPDYGVVCRDMFEGEEVLGIRLNWDKRYITLAPVATVLGLAFKLYDPDHLIGERESLGITCALIPTDLSGITIGRRHYPLNSAFPNGPTQGRDVFIPIDWIIGGVKMAGQGWRMVVECLSAGRAISLPSMSSGNAQVAAYASGAYARIRNQFHLPIGKFGGVEEALTRIAGLTYIMNAARIFTVTAIDRNEKPTVPAAITKYHVTELGRKVTNDAMDIHGGKGICMGPKNYLAINYQELPIGITVEGANILTRSMIIFGQGVIRCHPYVLKEMESASTSDKKTGLLQFDKAIIGHLGFVQGNAIRSLIMALTNAKFISAPKTTTKSYYQKFTFFSSALAFVSDMAMVSLRGNLKRKEKLSGRLGDVLSMLYLGSAVLKQHEEHGSQEYELPIIDWSCQMLLYTAQEKLYEALLNFPNRGLGRLLRIWVFPFGKRHSIPSDSLGHKLAGMMLNPSALRNSLGKDLYLANGTKNPLGSMEEVLQQIIAVEQLEEILHDAVHDKKIEGYTHQQRIHDAVIKEVITKEQGEKLLKADRARKEILSVDDFAPSELVDRFVDSDVRQGMSEELPGRHWQDSKRESNCKSQF